MRRHLIVCSEMASCFPSKEVAGVRFPSDETGFVVQLVRTLDFESKNLSSNLSLVILIVCNGIIPRKWYSPQTKMQFSS